MGAQPGDILDDGEFFLLNHLENNLTNQEAVENIARHFAKVSQEFKPIDTEALAPEIQDKLDVNSEEFGQIPQINELEVFNQIRKANKPKSGVPGDLPRALVKEFSPELAGPLTKIYKNIIQTGEWPSQWKVEFGIPIQKKSSPKDEDDLRIISLTAFYSKVMEKLVMKWLLEVIGHHIDWHQYGGQKGNSVAHYLIEFVNFVLFNQDLKNIHAVLAATIDFSKAFNRQNHNLLIELLSDLGVPGWLLRIVIGFLKNREMEVSYKGAKSSRQKMPGGGPQGTILGMFLFLILVNAIGFREAIKNTGKIITNQLNKRQSMKTIHLKFIDDMTIAEAIELRRQLVPNPDIDQPRPVNYHDRTGHVLGQGQSLVQKKLNEINEYAINKQMKINGEKCKIMLLNASRKYDFSPVINVGSEKLEMVEELKLLGVTIQSNLNWQTQTNNMCQKAYTRLWILRRLKPLGASLTELIEVYRTQIRCLLEFAVPVWNAGLTRAQENQIERVQKCALAIILSKNFHDYEHALNITDLKRLSERRHDLCLKFATKASKHVKFATWFCKSEQAGMETRTKKYPLKSVNARTSRYKKSPIAYLTKLLNEN